MRVVEIFVPAAGCTIGGQTIQGTLTREEQDAQLRRLCSARWIMRGPYDVGEDLYAPGYGPYDAHVEVYTHTGDRRVYGVAWIHEHIPDY